MTTLSGHHSSPSVNYYDHDGFSVDLSTAGFAAGSTWTFTLKATSTTCTDQIGYDVRLQRPLPSTESCFVWTGITPSGDPLATMTYGPSHVGDGVEWSGVSGATGCHDFTRITFSVNSFMYPGHCAIEWDWSLTYTPGASIAICAYGTEPKPADLPVVLISLGLLTSLVAAGVMAPWVIGMLGGVVGSAVLISQMCQKDKPIDQIITEADWTTQNPNGPGSVAEAKVLWNFGNVLWDTYCQCVPPPSGSPAPTPPPITIINTPTYLSVVDNIQIDNTEISTTINQLWQYFLSINLGNNNSLTVGQQTQTCACQDFKLGTAHEGLSGDGEISVQGIHGLSVIFTTLPERIGVQVGDPDTIWDAGWLNVGNDWGWQPRIYPNTTRWIAFPPDMHQMTRVGYSFPADVVATIAELVAA